MARKKYLQPFTRKPVSILEAEEEIRKAQENYDLAVGEYQRYLYTGKPGKQRRFNQVIWAQRGLEQAKADLEELRNPTPTLFP